MYVLILKFIIMKKIILPALILFCLSFNYSFAQKSTSGYYTQGKDYKSCVLYGYGTDKAGGYDRPLLAFNKFDKGSSNLYLKEIFAFSYYGTTQNANENGSDSLDENLEVFFIFSNDKKNKKWKLTKYTFGGEDKDAPDFYNNLFIYEIENISTGNTLNRSQIIDKLIESKEVVITVTDDLTETGEDNICRFQVKKHKNKIEKVFSDKHFSKDQELLN